MVITAVDERVVRWTGGIAVGTFVVNHLVVVFVGTGVSALDVRRTADHRSVLLINIGITGCHTDLHAAIYFISIASFSTGIDALEVHVAFDHGSILLIEIFANRSTDFSIVSNHVGAAIAAVCALEVCPSGDSGGVLFVKLAARFSTNLIAAINSVCRAITCRPALLAAGCLNEPVFAWTLCCVAVGFVVFGDLVVVVGAGCRTLEVRRPADHSSVFLIVMACASRGANLHTTIYLIGIFCVSAGVDALKVLLAANRHSVLLIELGLAGVSANLNISV